MNEESKREAYLGLSGGTDSRYGKSDVDSRSYSLEEELSLNNRKKSVSISFDESTKFSPRGRFVHHYTQRETSATIRESTKRSATKSSEE